MVLTKYQVWIFEYQYSKFIITAYAEIKKTQLSGKRAIVEQTEYNLGLVGSILTYKGFLWPFRVQGHLEVILYTCDFFS